MRQPVVAEAQMYIGKLRLRDVGVFVDATIDLNVPGATSNPRAPSNVTLLVGDNAVGKTTVLRAIAIAALATTREVPTTVARAMVRRSQGSRTTGRLDAGIVGIDGKSRQVEIDLRLRAFLRRRTDVGRRSRTRRPAFFVTAYGATRDVGTPPLDTRPRAATRYDQVASLFESRASYEHPFAWLAVLARDDRERHADVVSVLAAIVGPGAEMLGARPVGRSAARTIQAFSDGQRAHVAWVSDMLRCACASLPRGAPIADACGIVLVDQIEQHVHARWLARLLPSVARTLPGVQFVVSTHNPLVVGSVSRANVVVLAARVGAADEGTTVTRPMREVFGLSVDQLLAMGVFGDAQPRNDEVAAEIQRTAASARGGDVDAALRLLRVISLGGGGLDEDTAASRRGPDVRSA